MHSVEAFLVQFWLILPSVWLWHPSNVVTDEWDVLETPSMSSLPKFMGLMSNLMKLLLGSWRTEGSNREVTKHGHHCGTYIIVSMWAGRSIFENDALIVLINPPSPPCFKSPFRDKSPSPPHQLNIWRDIVVIWLYTFQ